MILQIGPSYQFFQQNCLPAVLESIPEKQLRWRKLHWIYLILFVKLYLIHHGSCLPVLPESLWTLTRPAIRKWLESQPLINPLYSHGGTHFEHLLSLIDGEEFFHSQSQFNFLKVIGFILFLTIYSEYSEIVTFNPDGGSDRCEPFLCIMGWSSESDLSLANGL